MNQQYMFGWGSAEIQSNFYAWSVWKSIGTDDEADKFYSETWESATEQGLTWFCQKVEDEIY